MTDLDIVMPYYGDVPLMQTAVRSVIEQTEPRWHLTVVDDGTEPGVPEWFAALNHPRISYQRNDHNLGITANFQKCLDLAQRDHLVMMGSDDVLLPNYVKTVLDLAEQHPKAAIIQPGVEVIDANGQPVRSLVDQAKKHLYAPTANGTLRAENLMVSLLRGNWLYFPSLCWRRSGLSAATFDQRWKVVQDLSVILPLIEDGGELVVDDQLCFQYRRHTLSVSSAGARQGSRFQEERAFFHEVAQRMDERGWTRAATAARWHLSSRLHALTMVPAAVRRRDSDGVRALTGHAFASPRP